MSYLKSLNDNLKYKYLIGTGGIGSGIFFKLRENHTLGRNESRPADIYPYRDYCKLHIIIHYLSVLLGSKSKKFEIFPIAKIGDDETGRILIEELKNTSIRLNALEVVKSKNTLLSVCFQYPDRSGGNITSANSASSDVSKEDIISFFTNFNDIPLYPEIFLSAPEVPTDARIELIKTGRKRGGFNIVSVTSSEVERFHRMDMFGNIDLIGLNIDEAGAISNLVNKKNNKETIAGCIEFLTSKNPNIMILITDGANGSYGCFKERIEHTKIIDVEVINTAGAGDAFLAGIIAGICCGLPFLREKSKDYCFKNYFESSIDLGSLIASLSVMSCDTINHEINTDYIRDFAMKNELVLSENFSKVLGLKHC
jgi:sugar/nucleoside kinase (ribokinase family)